MPSLPLPSPHGHRPWRLERTPSVANLVLCHFVRLVGPWSINCSCNCHDCCLIVALRPGRCAACPGGWGRGRRPGRGTAFGSHKPETKKQNTNPQRLAIGAVLWDIRSVLGRCVASGALRRDRGLRGHCAVGADGVRQDAVRPQAGEVQHFRRTVLRFQGARAQ